ncbi:phage tail protein [Lutispora thermophila]|uniref:Phage tail fibre repeat-containing protein n=1 Tax=Lutispora thermophila DSM 19022 TaxID=1122184 RepID=A0A1M6CR18_9FIRM|nr:phage tail protein [Lutispora thermophila]SHI63399.1 Phage tail fibre repeat-containing protein [Lutispora thermophila DSM 19022]
MKYTNNYNLKKPELTDYVNIEDFNENADIVDEKLKEIDNKVGNIKIPVTSVNGKTGAVELTASGVGAETPAGAQQKANTAANTVQTNFNAHKNESASTSAKGHVQLTDSVSSTSKDTAATPNSVKTVNDALTSHLNDSTKYITSAERTNWNNKAVQATYTVTLDTSWSGSSAPYTKTVTISDILETDNPIIDVTMSGTYATDTARQETWAKIYRAVTAANSITFSATEKPAVSIPIQIKVVR